MPVNKDSQLQLLNTAKEETWILLTVQKLYSTSNYDNAFY